MESRPSTFNILEQASSIRRNAVRNVPGQLISFRVNEHAKRSHWDEIGFDYLIKCEPGICVLPKAKVHIVRRLPGLDQYSAGFSPVRVQIRVSMQSVSCWTADN